MQNTKTPKKRLRHRKQEKIKQGYRLHLERLNRSKNSKTESFRTIKFPLFSKDRDSLLKIFNAVKNDYKFLVGSFNLNDYIEEIDSKIKNKNLLELWKESLAQGILILKTEADANKFYKKVFGSSSEKPCDKEINNFIEEIYSKTKLKIDKEKLISNFLLADQRKKETLNDLSKHLLSLKEDGDEKVDQLALENLLSEFWTNENPEKPLEDFKNTKKKLLEAYGIKLADFKNSNIAFKYSFFLSKELKEKNYSKKLEDHLLNRSELIKTLGLEKIDELCGLDNNASGLSNFLGTILEGNPPSNEIALEAYESLKPFLEDFSKPLLASPQDYRQQLSGILSSYVTNWTKRNKESQSNKFIEGLEKYREKIEEVGLKNDYDSLIKFSDKYSKNPNEENFILWDFEFGNFKSKLNETSIDKEPKEKIFKLKFDKPVNFPGDSKKILFDKFYYAHETFSKLISFYIDHLFTDSCLGATYKEEKSNKYREKYLKSLDLLSRGFSSHSSRFQHVLEAYFSEKVFRILDDDLKNLSIKTIHEKNHRFFLSPYSKGKFKELKFKEEPRYFEKLIELYIDLKPNFQEILDTFSKDHSNLNSVVSAVEIEKIRLGIKELLLENPETITRNDFKEYFQEVDRNKLHDFKTFDEALLDKEILDLRFQNLLLTTIKAKLNLLSHKEELARYVINPIDSEKKFLLSKNTNKYSLIFKNFVDKDSEKSIYDTYDKTTNKFINSRLASAPALEIRSSIYQVQFLNKLHEYLSNTSNTNLNLDISLSSWSLIAEEKYSIKWENLKDSAFKYPVLEKIPGSEKLYAALPFTFKSNNPEESFYKANRFLGLDVGESGIAFCVIETHKTEEKDEIKILDSGFIHSHLISKIRDQFSENQKIQRASSFARPSNKLGLIRENAIGTLRNRIHHLVCKYEALPVYEYQISNFETGSGRVTKIYNSVKQGQVAYKKEKIEEQLRKHFWGSRSGIGKEVSAWATSYTCLNCSNSHYDLIDSLVEKENLLEKASSGSYKIHLKDGSSIEANLYLPSYSENKKSFSKKELKKAFSDYARPPYESLNLDNKEDLKEIRGSQAIYRCPFCGNITDADIQAAFNISILAYLRSSLKKDILEEDEAKNDKERKKKEEFKKKERANWKKILKEAEIKVETEKNLKPKDYFLNSCFDFKNYISA